MFADTASVEQNGLRFFDVLGQFISPFTQVSYHELAVQHIHLTADGFDVELMIVVGHHLIRSGICLDCWWNFLRDFF